MDLRPLLAALGIAAASVAASHWFQPGYPTFRHAASLLLPLAVFAFPQYLEAGSRMAWRGEGRFGVPAPAIILQVAAGLALVALIAAHHGFFALMFK
jgi:hypothetical protein